jgi:hypothetical protein
VEGSPARLGLPFNLNSCFPTANTCSSLANTIISLRSQGIWQYFDRYFLGLIAKVLDFSVKV